MPNVTTPITESVQAIFIFFFFCKLDLVIAYFLIPTTEQFSLMAPNPNRVIFFKKKVQIWHTRSNMKTDCQ